MKKHSLAVFIFFLPLLNGCFAQSLEKSTVNNLNHAPLQGMIPANKAKLQVALQVVILEIACPDECSESEEWTPVSLKAGYYYLNMTSCGCGSKDTYKKIRICTEGFGCQEVKIIGGHLYKIHYHKDKGVIITRMTRE